MASPDRKDRTRPAELLLLAAGFGLFSGLVVLMSTRDIVMALIFFGVIFIVSLVVLAMLALASKPDRNEELDLGEQDEAGGERPGH